MRTYKSHLSKTWHAGWDYYIDAEARTRAEAEQEAMRLVDRVMQGTYNPVVIAFDNHLMVVWRDPATWHYHSYSRDARHHGGTCGFESREDAERAARAHMAQMHCPFTDCTALTPCDASKLIRDREDRTAHFRYARWQAGYRIARDRGNDDEACRAFADRCQTYGIERALASLTQSA